MAIYFFDSSALGKYYHPEVGSLEVERIVAEPGRLIIISRLTVVEMASVFAGKVRGGAITGPDALFLRSRFMRDIASGALQIVALTAEHYEAAEQLIVNHGTTYRIRSLDALQLAVATHVSSRVGLDRFVTADKAFCELATRAGLTVLNPEKPGP